MTPAEQLKLCISDLRMNAHALRESMKTTGIPTERKVELREHTDARKCGIRILTAALAELEKTC